MNRILIPRWKRDAETSVFTFYLFSQLLVPLNSLPSWVLRKTGSFPCLFWEPPSPNTAPRIDPLVVPPGSGAPARRFVCQSNTNTVTSWRHAVWFIRTTNAQSFSGLFLNANKTEVRTSQTRSRRKGWVLICPEWGRFWCRRLPCWMWMIPLRRVVDVIR